MHIIKKIINLWPFTTSRTNLIINEFRLNKDCIYVWGMKKSGQKIRKQKKRLGNLRICYLEDGFIHSFGRKKTRIPLSICKDKNGIFYNFKSKSDLFSLIKEPLSDKDTLRSKKIISQWKKFGISKYNYTNFLEPPKEPYILLIDQTFGDLSISYGGADVTSFKRMFDFAKQKWPNFLIVIKLHPEVINRRKKGCLDQKLYYEKNVKVISELGQLNNLIESCTALCVVTSQVGFEGLIYEKEVHVFGNPFYAGLGLTIDHCLFKERERKFHSSLEQLVFSSLVKYQTYLDPRNKKICELEKIIEYLYEIRKINDFFPNNLNCLNLTPWKARQINRYLSGLIDIKIVPFKRHKQSMKNVLVWGKSNNPVNELIKTDTFISVEDGFIRSVGLGGDLFRPMSLLFDKKGIHYDYANPSDLEDLLQNRVVNEQELKRSKELIRELKINEISKYNLIYKKNLFCKNKIYNKKIILVLGQVETDNSIIYGVPKNKIKPTNFSLVCKVKEDYPNHYIIYKPHPDLEEGLRSKGLEENNIKLVADSIANNTAINDLFKIADMVAVFTSLGGFEALIREIPVTCYGLPFYSGWGLTDDKFIDDSIRKRRRRKLSLVELVFIAIVEYPYYFSFKFNCQTEIENIIEEMNCHRNYKKNIEQTIFRYWGSFKDYLRHRFFFR